MPHSDGGGYLEASVDASKAYTRSLEKRVEPLEVMVMLFQAELHRVSRICDAEVGAEPP